MIDVNDLVGKPFVDDPEEGYGPHGYSCYGLLWEVYRRHGINLPKVNISVTACKEASNKEIEKGIARSWERIDNPVVPCGVLIKSTNPDYANHIGIYVGNGKMLHVTLSHNVEIARVDDYQRKIVGFYRYIGAGKEE